MIETLLPLFLSLLQSSLPLIAGKAPLIAKAADLMIAATPVIVSTYQKLAPIAKNIITSIKSDPTASRARIEQLEAAEALIDANFDRAALAAIEEDNRIEAEDAAELARRK